jgi:DNA processing protein
MKPQKVNTLTLNDTSYPEQLKRIDKPPGQLHFIGSHPKEWIDKPKVAIVGSRKATSYGRTVTEDIAGKLSRAGVVIISGLAYGIDAAAQQAALESGGLVVAVLATPLTRIYPAGHLQLANRIVKQGGTLISENNETVKIYRHSFLERNRLISGLADAVVIPEAAERSGSLNTARLGLEQGRTVMAVPGNVNSLTSTGCNNLIKAGAIPVTEAGDIFYALGIKTPGQVVSVNFRGTREEELILGLISSGIGSQEELALASKLDGPSINSVLTMLEIAGVIRPQGGGNWTAI